MAKVGRRTALKGFQNILNREVAEIRARGGKTAGGKSIRNPEAYVAAGLRRTGIKKLGAAGFKARMIAGRRRAKRG